MDGAAFSFGLVVGFLFCLVIWWRVDRRYWR